MVHGGGASDVSDGLAGLAPSQGLALLMQVPRAAGKPVEPRDHEDVAREDRRHGALQARANRDGAKTLSE